MQTTIQITIRGIACAALLALTLTGATAVAGDRPAPADLDALAWMAGHWKLESERRTVEELWLPPRGGLMLGLNRTVPKAGGNAQFEYLRIEQREDGIFLLASPSGVSPTPFKLVAAQEGHAVFENPEHDFPTRIEYRLAGDRLIASIAGDEPGPSWTYERVGDVK